MAEGQTGEGIGDYLVGYYDFIGSKLVDRDGRLIKTIGDCVLVELDRGTSLDQIMDLYREIKEAYEIGMSYRMCRYVERRLQYGDYSVRDVFGSDVNGLFMRDEETLRAGP